MTELPAGWTAAVVGDLGLQGEQTVMTGPFGSHMRASEFSTSGIPVLTIGCLTEHGISLTKANYLAETKAKPLARYRLRAGDMLFSRMASVGRAGMVTKDLDGVLFNYHLMRLRIDSDVYEPELFLAFVRGAPQVRKYLEDVNHGATRDGVNTEQLLAMPVLVPPRDEQRRILAKLDEIFDQTRAAKARLERLPTLFLQLKRSILAAAFRGDLTADWREANPDVEPASTLAERIRAQRDERTSLPTDTAYSSELPDVELPNTWFVALTANVGSVQLGRQLSAGKYTGALHPYVRVANVADDRLSFEDIKEMEFSPQELEHYLLRPGDIVLSEGQSLDRLGQSAMYQAGDPAVCFQKTLNRFRATAGGVLPEYAQLYFRFCMHTGVFRAAGSITTNIAHLTQEKLRRIPFVLCPVEEQRVLIERVRGALARLEALEAAVVAARAKLAEVEHAALTKAFRGELVPQDPTDEPASLLLERLRGASIQQDERTETPPAKRSQRRSAKAGVGASARSTETIEG